MASAGLVVIGSGPAGVSAADAFRQHNPQLPVRIVTEDAAAPYFRPPLSKEYLRGDDSDINLHPADWFDDHSIALTRNSTVCDIDISGKTVLDTDGVRYEYQWLVLTCGAGPTPLPVPGGQSALLLRSLADAARLRAAARHSATAVVVGAGFIGCEAAASLALQGVSTIVVSPEAVPQAARLGSDVGHRIVDLLADAGVSYAGGVTVTGLGDGKVRLDNGVTLDCDLVLTATGIHPDRDWPKRPASRRSRAGSPSTNTSAPPPRMSSPPATSRWPTIQPLDDGWRSNIGKTPSTRVRWRGPTRPADRLPGTACPAFGPRSGTPR